ncbi:hypothetical protein T492DRAFT_606734 [Pavlovales sp. CCMP2436]|nr:hypothetical protein T492DRAFT_606734 [Pavlovales sp. CCMP2436]
MSFVPGDLPAAEYEFFAENTIVTIVPNLVLPKLNLIQGDFGPFQPLIPAEMPLWLALVLKKRQRCSVQPPSWLGVQELERRLEGEKRNPRFQELPQHFFEIAHLLLEAARDDMGDAHKVEGLVEDLENRRYAKLRAKLADGADGEAGGAEMLRLDGLTPIEINRVRRFATGALDTLAKLRPASEAQAQSQAWQPQQAVVDDEAVNARLRRR